MAETELQEHLDRFYWRNGPCCAGCDWWRSHSSLTGDCTRSAPVSGRERASMLGISSPSFPPISAGHVITPRGHVCGEFRDEFDWPSLPLPYRVRVGAPTGRLNGNALPSTKGLAAASLPTIADPVKEGGR